MSRVEKTVFISYRRTSASWALNIYQHLTQHGYDVFFDFIGIASGDFERVILENIKIDWQQMTTFRPNCGDKWQQMTTFRLEVWN